jgi:hypothetical protein
MKIVFLGWGSLIWDPCDLRIRGEWHEDGPYLPVEFARISKNRRLTLVLYSNADRVQVLWAYAKVNSLDKAVEDLRQREGTKQCLIGFDSIKENKSRCQVVPEVLNEIRDWATKKRLDAVVWTDLPSNFKEKRRKELNANNVIEYLENLPDEEQQRAREYIEKAPPQIMTTKRRIIKKELGWGL